MLSVSKVRGVEGDGRADGIHGLKACAIAAWLLFFLLPFSLLPPLPPTPSFLSFFETGTWVFLTVLEVAAFFDSWENINPPGPFWAN